MSNQNNMRTFNKRHIQKYKASGFCIDKYSNISDTELEELQHSDPKLQTELMFTSLLERIGHHIDRSNRSELKFKSKLNEIRQGDLELKRKLNQLKKINNPTLGLDEEQDLTQGQSGKNYRNLFSESIDRKQWSDQELSIRNEYLKEYDKVIKRSGQCSSCTRNALIRKYIKKLEALVSDSEE